MVRLITLSIVGFGLLLPACRQSGSKARRLVEVQTLSYKDKDLLGAYVAHDMVRALYPNQNVAYNAKSFDAWKKEGNHGSLSEAKNLYLIVAPAVKAYQKEAEALKEFVSLGNTVVVATDNISEQFAEVFHVGINDIPLGARYERYTDTWLTLKDTAAFAKKRYGFYYEPFDRVWKYDTLMSNVYPLSLNPAGMPSALQLSIGRGKLFLLTNANSLSNYFLLSQNNDAYLQALAAYWPEEISSLFWDDFYHRNTNRRPENSSIWDALFAIPELKYALILLIVLGLLWVLSHMRRLQRLVPVLPINTNSSLAFTETVARLYFNEHDNNNMGRKITTHLQTYLHQRFYLQTGSGQTDWASVLAQKTSLTPEDARLLNQLMKQAESDRPLTDEDLLHMHDLSRQAMQSSQAAAPVSR